MPVERRFVGMGPLRKYLEEARARWGPDRRGRVAEHVAAHFVAAGIRRFPAPELDAAKKWVMDRV